MANNISRAMIVPAMAALPAILFLDFDGVLHPAGAGSEKMVRRPLLEGFLRDPACAHVAVVISSTWREALSIDKLRHLFPADLQPRIIGCTPVLEDTDSDFPRYREIRAWLNRHPLVKRWAALDDSADQFPAPSHANAVFTDPEVGLTDASIAALRKLLSSA